MSLKNFNQVTGEVELETNGSNGDLDNDDLDLLQMGHTPALQRNFSRFSLLALSFMIVDSWLGISTSLGTGISSGGTAMLIYGSLGASFFTLCIALSLAEIGGAYPTSGGQYHWTKTLAPKKISRISSYLCGYYNTFGWCTTSASVNLALSQFVMAIIILCHPDIEYHRWQGFIIYQVMNIIITFMNVFGHSIIPIFNKAGFLICLSAFIVINCTLIATADKRNSAKFVFASFTNNTGYESNPLAFIVGLSCTAFSYGGLDGSIHISEELKDAKKTLPKILVMTVVIGFVTMFLTAIVISFSIQDLNGLIDTPTGVPIIELLYQTTKNKGASVFLSTVLLYLTMSAFIGCQGTSNRLIWAFARDHGLPVSHKLSIVNSKFKVPVNASILCWFIISILGCIYLGSSTAFNALVGCNALMGYISFAFPIAFLLLGGRKRLSKSTFELGPVFGSILNILALGWIIFAVVMLEFPYTKPVTAGNMNYSSAIIGGTGIIALICWIISGRKHYFEDKLEEKIISEISQSI
ncbi:uncharacterized protein PRCAT00005004001 [Priceomyces carsonii]|uniref:uncharacterized protein n=1 Tax=Priceomyces carsonii TaxID=28549 RepID=UPI002ED8E7B5|nr:unnamed protein product [Priceomyces carsonii]